MHSSMIIKHQVDQEFIDQVIFEEVETYREHVVSYNAFGRPTSPSGMTCFNSENLGSELDKAPLIEGISERKILPKLTKFGSGFYRNGPHHDRKNTLFWDGFDLDKYKEDLFPSERGTTIRAQSYINDPNERTIVLIPGMLSNESLLGNLSKKSYFRDYLLRKNYNMVTLFVSAKGGGDTYTFGVREHLDVLSGLQRSINKYKLNNILLVGHSLGAAAVCKASDKLPPEVRGVVVSASFHDPLAIFKNLEKEISSRFLFLISTTTAFLAELWAEVCTSTKNWQNPDSFSTIKKCKVPIMFSANMDDNVVPCQQTVELYEQSKIGGCNSKLNLNISGGHRLSIGGDTLLFWNKCDF